MFLWKGCHGQRKIKLSTMMAQVCIPCCQFIPDKAGIYLCKRKHLQKASLASRHTREVSSKTIFICSSLLNQAWGKLLQLLKNGRLFNNDIIIKSIIYAKHTLKLQNVI